jgi:hypothetical protein
MVWPTSSGSAPGDQWLSAAIRENGALLSGLRLDSAKPPAKTISSLSVLRPAAATR